MIFTAATIVTFPLLRQQIGASIFHFLPCLGYSLFLTSNHIQRHYHEGLNKIESQIGKSRTENLFILIFRTFHSKTHFAFSQNQIIEAVFILASENEIFNY